MRVPVGTGPSHPWVDSFSALDLQLHLPAMDPALEPRHSLSRALSLENSCSKGKVEDANSEEENPD
jgi:hypothetical protein